MEFYILHDMWYYFKRCIVAVRKDWHGLSFRSGLIER